MPASLTTQAALSIVIEQARRRAVPYGAYVAAHGIVIALISERCSRAVRLWLKVMPPDELLGLVAEVANVCVTIGAVPRYLSGRGAAGLGAVA